MTTVLKSLDNITTAYTVFEKDQVLTHEQLNRLAAYLDDQTRLSRIALLGVGLGCGLRASLAGWNIHLTKGAGVTTDGDLIVRLEDSVFDGFKPYDETAPEYAPLHREGARQPLFELVSSDGEPDASPLEAFEGRTGMSLSDAVVLILMESYEKDYDLCSGTDCDNLGNDLVNNQRLLLIPSALAETLLEDLPTLDRAGQRLTPLVADRPIMQPPMESTEELAAVYRAATSSINGQLTKALAGLYPACSGFLGDLFDVDPTQAWLGRLAQVADAFTQSSVGLQYYYDFLKDLVETFNDIRDSLLGQTVVCCPDIGAFPKHLLAGHLTGEVAPSTHRTGFYPSPMVGGTTDEWAHARALIWKIHVLLHTFDLPVDAGAPIRVTPSFPDDHPLEERAIPFYYDVNERLPVHEAWSYPLTKKGMERSNYSYNADRYGAEGAAAKPLTTHFGGRSFFRIEGHLGSSVAEAVKVIEVEVSRHNLPLAVQAVMLGSDRSQLLKRLPRYSDLHRFQDLLRHDVASQLGTVQQFSAVFKGQVDKAVDEQVVNNTTEGNDGITVKDLVADKHAHIVEKALAAQESLQKPYAHFRADVTWRQDLHDTLETVASFKSDLGKVAKTDFVTPFDTLIGSTHLHWIDWLDEIVTDKDAKEEKKLQFSTFASEHPGLEHAAGVPSGGTFVVVYDTSQVVVADFMLPYLCYEWQEDEPEPPKLPPPKIPPIILDKGLKVLPSLEKYVGEKLKVFKGQIEPLWKADLDAQQHYVSGMIDSFDHLADIIVNPKMQEVVNPPGVLTQPVATGIRTIDDQLVKAAELAAEIDGIKISMLDPSLTKTERTTLGRKLQARETALGNTIIEATRGVAEAGLDVNPGSPGAKAMGAVAGHLTTINNTKALERVADGMRTVSVGAEPPMAGVIDGVIKTRGLGR